MKNFIFIPIFAILISACGVENIQTQTQIVEQVAPTASSTPSTTALPPSSTPTPGEPTKTPRPTPTLPAIPEVACIPGEGERTSGIVTGVVDGDTITVSIRGLTHRIRYLGIDTPETRNPETGIELGGKSASERNLELVRGAHVTLVSDPADNDVDPYGRFLRYVIVGDVFVNYQLVREGLATLYISGINCGPEFLAAYEAARIDHVGLFAPTPTQEN